VKTEALITALGVQVSGVDLSASLSTDVAAELRRLFAAHSLLLFRDQTLSPDDQHRLVSSLGEVSIALLPPPRSDGDEVGFFLSSEYADGRGELEPHSDHCFLDRPLWGISLYALAAPQTGGETIFTSATGACRDIAPDVERSVAGRTAVHTYRARKRLGDEIRDASFPDELSAEHPVIWQHPVTGTPVLYVNPSMTDHIVGIDPEESRRLLARLLDHLADLSINYRHRWRPGDFIVWDNIALMHARTAYDPAEPRLLYRLQLALP
jgi:taurine dioxygenase